VRLAVDRGAEPAVRSAQEQAKRGSARAPTASNYLGNGRYGFAAAQSTTRQPLSSYTTAAEPGRPGFTAGITKAQGLSPGVWRPAAPAPPPRIMEMRSERLLTKTREVPPPPLFLPVTLFT